MLDMCVLSHDILKQEIYMIQNWTDLEQNEHI